MTDTFGATSLPVASVITPTTDSLADPARALVLSFCKSVIEYECGTAWAALATAGEPICRTAWPHDPGKEDFDPRKLPALFCYRSSTIKPQRFTDEEWGDEASLELLWVFPPAPDANQATRRGIMVGLSRALHKAFGPLNGRHPSWVVTGDTDPYAAVYGSSLLTWGHFEIIELEQVREAQVKVDVAGKPVDYQAVNVTFRCREEYVPGDTLGGLQTIIIQQKNADGDVGLVQEIALAPLDFSDAFDEAFS